MGDSFWTSYSDLFVGMSVIFLVLFFFATLRAGVLQMQNAMNKKEHEETLKGNISKDAEERSRSRTETVKNTLTDIQKKKEELSDLAKNLEAQQNVFTDVIKEQEERTAQLKVAYDNNQKLDTQVKDLSNLKDRLQTGLREKDDAISSLTIKMQELESAKVNWARTFEDLNNSLKAKDAQIDKGAAKIEQLTQSLEKETSAVEQAQRSLETEQSKSARLYQELQANGRELQKTLAELDENSRQMNLLKQDVTNRDGTINRLKKEVADDGKALDGLRGEVAGYKHETENLRADLNARDGSLLKLNKDLADALREMGGLKKEVMARNVEINSLKASNSGLQHDLAGRDGQITSLKGELGVAKSQVGGLTEDLAVRDGQIGKLKGALGDVQKQLSGRDGDVAKLQGELASAKRANGGLGGELSGRDQQISKLKGEIAGLEREMAGRDGTLAKMKGQLGAAGSELGALKNELERYKKFYNDAQGSGKEQARTIASLGDELKKAHDEINELSKMRKQIAGGVLRNLRDNGVDVAVDPESGVITLSMDEVFRFKNGSYEIADASKAKIKKIMPVYAKSLFGSPEQAAKIAGVVITGHASPRYKRKYVDPRGHDRVAYIFNLDLSMKRAHQVAAYIFGEEIGYYPHKQELKERTSVAGKGYMEPTARVAGGDTTEPCGQYDCPKSRRVEINFILKETKKAAQELANQTRPIDPQAPIAPTPVPGEHPIQRLP
ncbi:MAG: OmpA family protein, partial [Deltaproteobacteria bacterium]|nr:OmpA family protein [Deltaproteobacteria bacterium]